MVTDSALSHLLAVPILAVSVCAMASPAQPRFDVVSIRRSPQPGRIVDSVVSNFLKSVASSSRNGRFRMDGPASVPVSMLIRLAYNLEDFQVEGLPSWGNSERYAVIAKAPDNTTFEQMRPMIAAMLADRFQLRFHRETRELPIYELTIGRGGLKVLASRQGECLALDKDHPRPEPGKPHLPFCGAVVRQRDSIEAGGISMAKLAELLSEQAGRPVVDKTGFTEAFNLQLNFSPEISIQGDSGAAVPSLFTALQEQMGLRLESSKGPVEVLVIDRLEKPSEN